MMLRNLLMAVLLCLGLNSPAATPIFYVNQNGTNTVQNGTSWATAYRELRDALTNNIIANNVATGFDKAEVWVAGGTYKPTPGNDRNAAFVLFSSVNLRGGFAGTESQAAQRQFGTNGLPVVSTVLSGDIGTAQPGAVTAQTLQSQLGQLTFTNLSGYGDNSYNVVRSANNAIFAQLEGFIITGGNADPSTNEVNGGQIYAMSIPKPGATNGETAHALDNRVAGGGLLVANTKNGRGRNYFTRPFPGAGASLLDLMNAADSDVGVAHCYFINNTAGGYGGGMASKEAMVAVIHTQFRLNTAAYQGGGFWGQSQDSLFLDCTFDGNLALRTGGGAHLETIPSIWSLTYSYDEHVARAQDYIGNANLGVDMLAAAGAEKDNGLFADKDKIAKLAIKGTTFIAKKIVQKVYKEAIGVLTEGATAAVAESLGLELSSAASLASGAGYVLMAMTAFDTAITVAEFFGADINQPWIQEWRKYYAVIKIFSSPSSLVNYLATAIYDLITADQAPSYAFTAQKLWREDQAHYNMARASRFFQCRFLNNTSVGMAGGLLVCHDNVLVEGSLFKRNQATSGAGAAQFMGYNRPLVYNTVFEGNMAQSGHSAVVNAYKTQARYFNCNFIGNASYLSNGYAMDVEMGANVILANSIFWQNYLLNRIGFAEGADLFVASYNDLGTKGKEQYNQAGAGRWGYIGIADVRNCNIQSLAEVKLGKGLFYNNGENNVPTSGDGDATYNYDSHPYPNNGLVQPNVGDGIRDLARTPAFGNISTAPQLAANYAPYPSSPGVGAGKRSLATNGWVQPVLGRDFLNRTYTGKDIGAVEGDGNYPPGQILYVNQNVSGGNQTGTNWANAMRSIPANATLGAGSSIWVAAGSYEGGIVLPAGVSIFGGFAGGETNVSQSRPATRITAITAKAGTDGLKTAGGQPAVVHGLMFAQHEYGGDQRALRAVGPVQIQSCNFMTNGRAILVSGDAVGFLECQFIGNRVGALTSEAKNTVIRNCRFDRNQAAGVVLKGTGTAQIWGSEFFGNDSYDKGGAIFSEQSSLSVQNCTIVGNKAIQSAAPGGGAGVAYVGNGSFSLVNTMLVGNRLSLYGTEVGVEYHQVNRATLVDSCIVEGLTFMPAVNSFDKDPGFYANPNNPVTEAFFSSYGTDGGTDGYSANLYTTNDLKGNPRISGGRIDIGAFENLSSGNTTNVNVTLTQECGPNGPTFVLTMGVNTLYNRANWEVNRLDGRGYATLDARADGTTLPKLYYPNGNGGETFSTDAGLISSRTPTKTLRIVNPPASMKGYLFRASGKVDAGPGINPDFITPSVTLPAYTARLYVKADAGGANNGSSWANAYTDLKSALAVATNSCNQIWVAKGTYAAGTYQLRPGVPVYGGFAGNETELARRNPALNPTILRSAGGPAVACSSSFADGTTVLDGFVLQQNVAGPALQVAAGSPLLRNCSFTGSAGGTYAVLNSGNPTFTNCQFSGYSQAAFVNNSSATLLGCAFTGNTEGTTAAAINNAAGAVLQVTDSTFSGNTGGLAGAIYNVRNSQLGVLRCKFQNNTGNNGAGAIYNGTNSAASVFNTLLANNLSKTSGGAIGHYGAGLQLVHCTVANNRATSGGGGLFLAGSGNTNWNSIFWGNTVQNSAVNVEALQISPVTLAVVKGSTVEGLVNFSGEGNIGYPPFFAAEESGYYQLSYVSPGVDAARTDAPASGGLDLDRTARIWNGVAPDMGAYETFGSSEPIRIQSLSSVINGCLNKAYLTVVTAPGGASSFAWYDQNYFPLGTGTPGFTVTSEGATNRLTIHDVAAVAGQSIRLVVNSYYQVKPFVLTIPPSQRLYVDGSVGSSGNGQSWGQAFKTIQEALAAANVCAEIWVKAGTYQGGTVGGQPLALRAGASLYGGFAGGEDQLSQRNMSANLTRLTPGNGGQMVTAIGTDLVPVDQTTLLDGFTLSGATNLAALDIRRANPLVQNCTFESNRVGVSMTNSIGLTFDRCTFRANTVAGLQASTSTNVLVKASRFTDGNGGSALVASNSVINVTGSSFLSNQSPADPSVRAVGSGLTLLNTVFSNNVATATGGSALGAHNSRVTLDGALVFANRNNGEGAALYGVSAQFSLLNNTVVSNFSQDLSAGLFQTNGTLQIRNSIFWDNASALEASGPEQSQLAVGGLVPDIAFSIIGGLEQFQNNAGNNSAYDPVFLNPAAGNFELTSISPAVGTGETNGIADTAKDGLGRLRLRDGVVDLGAFAFSGTAGTPSYLAYDFSARTVCYTRGTTFSLYDKSGAALAVTWQMDSGAGFADVVNDGNHLVTPAGNGSSLIISAVDAGFNGRKYRMLVSGSVAFTSPAVTLTVNPQSVVYVDAAATGANNGTSWANAYRSLGNAVVTSCDVVWMAEGNYNETINPKAGVQVYGGFPAGGDWASRNPDLHPTIIQLSAATDGFVFGRREAWGQHTLLDGVTFRGTGQGGRIENGASPIFANCRFETFASGVFVVQGGASVLLTNCVLTGNGAPGVANGAALKLYGTAATLQNCTFQNNLQAVNASNGRLTVQNSRFFTNGLATADGGAILMDRGSATFTGSRFTGNIGRDGGAVRGNFTRLAFRNCQFDGNQATATAGAIFSQNEFVSLDNCTVVGNRAGGRAGIYVEPRNGPLTVNNSIFWGNVSATPSVAATEASQFFAANNNQTVANTLIQYRRGQNEAMVSGYDPLFANAAAGDYTLTARSPAVNGGNNAAVPAGEKDLAGNARIQNGTVDLGATESAHAGGNALLVGAGPLSVNGCLESTVNFELPGQTNYAYQWQYSFGSGWTNLAHGETLLGVAVLVTNDNGVSRLTLSNLNLDLNGLQVRDLLTGESFTSQVATLTVYPTPVIYVDASAAPGGDGRSWTNAYRNLSQGLSSAGLEFCRAEVRVAQGTYSTADGSLTVPVGASVYGGFPTGGGSLAARNPQAYPVVVTNPNPSTATLEFRQGAGTNTVVDGLAIRGGAIGVNCFRATPTLRNLFIADTKSVGVSLSQGVGPVVIGCVFSNHQQVALGLSEVQGALVSQCLFLSNRVVQATEPTVKISGGSADLNDCTFAGNSGPRGVVGSTAGILNLARCRFQDNVLAGNVVSVAGGVNASGLSLNVSDCVFTNNTGLAIFNTQGTANIVRSEFRNIVPVGPFIAAGLRHTGTQLNLSESTFAGNSGPAVAVSSGATVVSNSVFHGNGRFGSSASVGVDFAGSQLLVTGCTFTNNQGRALLHVSGTADVTNSLFLNNTNLTAGQGGVVTVQGGLMNVAGSRFMGNSASSGGAVLLSGGTLDIVRSRFTGNTATLGGALSSANGTVLRLRDSLFAGNQAGEQGGAVYNLGNLSVVHGTVTDNTAAGNGGGLALTGGTAALVNTLVWGNRSTSATVTNTEAAEIYSTAGLALTNVFVGAKKTLTGQNVYEWNPYFNNAAAGDYTLAAHSPAINAGHAAYVLGGETDLAGGARLQSVAPDLGAYESAGAGTDVLYAGEQPQPVLGCAGNTAVFRTRGAVDYTFDWQYNQGGGWNSFVAGTPLAGSPVGLSNVGGLATLTLTNVLETLNNLQVRVVYVDHAFTSAVVTLTVYSPTIYVDASAAPGGNGLSWATAFQDIGSGLVAARREGCRPEVWIAEGTYPHSGANYLVAARVSVYGGFPAGGGNWAARNPEAHPTILNNTPTGVAFSLEGGAGPDTILDGLVINGGNRGVDGSLGAAPTLRNLTVRNTTGYGITLANGSGAVVESCTLSNNVSRGLHLLAMGNVAITQCLFTNNGDTAFSANDSQASVSNVVVAGNTGGGLALNGGNVTVSRSQFAGNSGGNGTAGIRISAGTQLVINECNFTGNTNLTEGNGGALRVSGGANAQVNRSRFIGNVAKTGGAIYADSGAGLQVRDCLFDGNRAQVQAGAIMNTGNLGLFGSTLTANVSGGNGGGLVQVGITGGRAAVVNSIIWGNLSTSQFVTNTEPAEIYVLGNGLTLTNVLLGFRKTLGGPEVYDWNPLFVNAANGDYTLAANSPAINVGNAAHVLVGETDFAGNARLRQEAPDLGAYESDVAGTNGLYLGQLPVGAVGCVNSTVTFRARGAASYTFDWQYNFGGGWSNFTAGAWMEGSTVTTNNVDGLATLTLANLGAGLDGLQVRVIFSGQSFTSAPVTLEMVTSPIMYVDAAAAPGGNGQSWGTAFRSLYDALLKTTDCNNTVLVAEGTYEAALRIRPHVKIYGGFPTGGGVMETRNPQAHPVMVTGAGVAVEAGAGPDTIMDGLVIDGKTLEVTAATPTLQNLVLRGATTGLNLVNAAVTATNLRVENNTEGGVNLDNSQITLVNSRVLGNGGVGITLNGGSEATITNSIVQGNNGGGLRIESSRLTLAGGLVAGNNGGLRFVNSTSVLAQVTVAANREAFGNGLFHGGILAEQSDLTLLNAIVWDNRSKEPADTFESQQISTNGGRLALTNVTVEGITSGSGPGVTNLAPIFAQAIDPQTTPTQAGDFRLRACSPVLERGAAALVPGLTVDLDGNARVAGGAADLGAYEFGGTAAGTPLAILRQPEDFTFLGNGNSSASVTATGEGLTYDWQLAAPGGTNPFTSLQGVAGMAGADTATLTVNQIARTLNGALLRCRLQTAAGCELYTRSAVLTVYAGRYYVNAATTNTLPDGLSWETAFQTLQQLSETPASPGGTEVWLAGGHYQMPNGYSFNLQSKQLLFGGFAGTETNLSQRSGQTNVTKVAGTAGGLPVFRGKNLSGSVLDGIEFNGGNGTFVYLEGTGSGLLVANCRLLNARGGVSLEPGASARVTGSYFGNLTNAVSVTDGNLTVSNSVFATNRTALYQRAGQVTVADSQFVGNNLGVESYRQGNLLVQGSTFAGNTAVMTAGDRMNVILRHSTFTGNGGPVSLRSGSPVVEYCVFQGNVGTALFLDHPAAYAQVRNCLFSGNSGAKVMENYDAFGTALRNVTITGNKGTGLRIQYPGTLLAVNNSVLCHNGTDVDGVIASGTGNVIGEDPGFIGPVSSASAPTLAGNFHLQPCSVKLNTGTNDPADGTRTDLDGQPRLYAGTVDPGAYEWQGAQLVFALQPTNVTASLGQTAAFTAVAADAGVSGYQWQASAGNGTFTNLPVGVPYAGVTNTTLSFAATAGLSGKAYRLVASYPAGCSLISQPATFTYYVSPVASSGLQNGLPPVGSTNFSFVIGGGLNSATLNDQSVFIYGAQSGRHLLGGFVVDGNKVTLQPAGPFLPGERVAVTVSDRLKTPEGFAAAGYHWEFVNAVDSWDGNFTPEQAVGVGGANVVATGDVNGDGAVDLVVSTTDGTQVRTNNGAGEFTDSAQVLGTNPAAKIVLGNLRGTGGLDVVLLRNGQFETWTNNGSGQFTLAAAYNAVALDPAVTLTAPAVTDLALGDLNNDGAQDLFVLTPEGEQVWWNNGAGLFTNDGFVFEDANAISVALGDFQGDGRLDACVVYNNQRKGRIYGNTGGSFTSYFEPAHLNGGLQRVVAADVTGDGILDLVTVTQPYFNQGYVSVKRGYGNGDFTFLWEVPAQRGNALSVGDINGDRKQDLVLTSASGDVVPYISTGGGFQRMPHVGIFASAQATALGDLDGDGALDLAMVHNNGQLTTAFYQPTQLYGAAETRLPLAASVFPVQFAQHRTNVLTGIVVTDLPAHGTVYFDNVAVTNGQVIPVAGLTNLAYEGAFLHYGRDQFMWQGTDAGGTWPDLFTFNISLQFVSHDVTAVDDAITVGQLETVSVLTNGAFSLLANDTNLDGGTFVARLATAPVSGTLVLNADGTFRYQQNGSSAHSDSFAYWAVNPGTGESNRATVSVSIINVNDAPSEIRLAATSFYEGEPADLVVGVLSAQSPDAAVEGFYFGLQSGPGDANNGDFYIEDNVLKTTGPLSYADGGIRTIRVRAYSWETEYNDEGESYLDQVFTVQVLPLPTAYPQSLETGENGDALAIHLEGTGQAGLHYVLVDQPTNGTLTGTAPDVAYRPGKNYVGPDSLSYFVTDGVKTSAVETVSIYVYFVDQPPVADPLELTTLQNVPVGFTLTATPFTNLPMTFKLLGAPFRGTLSGVPPNLTYTPNSNFSGGDFFRFTASDGILESTPTVVSINVTHVNQPPEAFPRTNETAYTFTPLTINLGGYDIDSTRISYRIVTPPEHAALSLQAHADDLIGTLRPLGALARVVYHSQFGFTGTDSFTYVTSDGELESAPATVTIEVKAAPLPTVQPLTFNLDENGIQGIQLFGSDPLFKQYYTVVSTPPAHGTLQPATTSQGYGTLALLYRPQPGFHGVDQFQYRVESVDGRLSEPGTVTLNVLQAYVPPVAGSFGMVTTHPFNQDTPLTLTLPVTNLYGLPLTYEIVEAPAHGTIVGTNFPTVNFLLAPYFSGNDHFTYRVSDGVSTSATARVDFIVQVPPHGVYTEFARNNQYAFETYAGIPITIPVLATNRTEWGLSQFFGVLTAPTEGTLAYTATNFTYTPPAYLPEGSLLRLDLDVITANTQLDSRMTNRILVFVRPRVIDLYSPTVADFIEAVRVANAADPSYETVIRVNGANINLTEALAATEDGDASALKITGNIRIAGGIVDVSQKTNVTIKVDELALPMRHFQVAPGARLVLQNCTLVGGRAQQGGSIYNEGNLSLLGSTLRRNTAAYGLDSAGQGGAIYNRNGWVGLTNVFLTNNVADVGGAYYQLGDGTAATLNASNVVMKGHGGVFDFYSTNLHGGTAAILQSGLSVETPSQPWFGLDKAVYQVRGILDVPFQMPTDVQQYPLSAVGGQIIGLSPHTRRFLAAGGNYGTSFAAEVQADNGHQKYTARFEVRSSFTDYEKPVAYDMNLVVPPGGKVRIPLQVHNVGGFVEVEDYPHGSHGDWDLLHLPGGLSFQYTQNHPWTTDSTYYVLNGGSTGRVNIITRSDFNLYVYSANNSGPGTLREALDYANQYYTDQGWVIYLLIADVPLLTADDLDGSHSALSIRQNVIIDGGRVGNAVIRPADSAEAMRLFRVHKRGRLTLRNVTVQDGRAEPSLDGAGQGGAIFNEGELVLENAVLTGNRAVPATWQQGWGGAIFNLGNVAMTNAQILDNVADNGGGVYQEANGGTVTNQMVDTRISNPNGGYDVVSVSGNGTGDAVTVAGNSSIQNPAMPWIGTVGSSYSLSGEGITFPVGLGNGAILTAEGDNYYVSPEDSQHLTLTADGTLRTLHVDPVYSGVINVTLKARQNRVSFLRTIEVGALGGETIPIILFDKHITAYRGDGQMVSLLPDVINLAKASLRIASVQATARASVTVSNDGVFYAHGGSADTNDFFTYVVTNNFGAWAIGRVFVEIRTPEIIVDNLAEGVILDPPGGSFRAAVQAANQRGGAWTIKISPALAGQTLVLSSYSGYDYSWMYITNHVRIDGSDAPGFTLYVSQNVYAAPDMRHFRVEPEGFLDIRNVTLAGGRAYHFTDIPTSGLGGAIYNEGRLVVSNVTFIGNRSQGGSYGSGLGGAILNDGGVAEVSSSLFTNNWVTGSQGTNQGGAIANRNGTMTLTGNTIINCRASGVGTPGVYNLGETNTALLNLRGNTISNGVVAEVGPGDEGGGGGYYRGGGAGPAMVPVADLLGATASTNGYSKIVSFGSNDIAVAAAPYVGTITNRVVQGAGEVPFAFSNLLETATLTASAANTNLLGDGQMFITGPDTNTPGSGVLLITNVIYSGITDVRLELTEGRLSYAQVFRTTLIGLPSAPDQTYQTTADAPISFNVLDGALGAGLSVLSYQNGAVVGTLQHTGNGLFSYDPAGQLNYLAAGQKWTNTFTCTLVDNGSHEVTLTVSIVVTGGGGSGGLTARNVVVKRIPGQAVQIPITRLLETFSGAVGLVQWDTPSTNGVGISVSQSSQFLIYGASTNEAVDAFQFGLMTSSGQIAVGTVQLVVGPANFVVLNPGATSPADTNFFVVTPEVAPVASDGRNVTLRFTGEAGASYLVQYTVDITGGIWVTAGTVQPGPDGNIYVRDVAPPDDHRFYRIIPAP